MLNRFKKHIRFIGFFEEAPALHFHIMQFVVFAYMIYRFASRDYTIYGFIDDGQFDYPFSFRNELFPIPLGYFFTFQFIYLLVDHPSAEIISLMQYIVIGSAVLGLVGLLPKLMSITSFILAAHITGLYQSADGPIDGGTIVLCALLIMALSSKSAFYNVRNKYKSEIRRSIEYHWPIVAVMIITGMFYTAAGIAKIVDVGPHWPFVLHLEMKAALNLEDGFFLSSRYSNLLVSALHQSEISSILGGIVTVIGEVFFIGILWIPRWRPFMILSMVMLHVLVFLTAGINFVGSSMILLLCFDYNMINRSATIIHLDPSLKLIKDYISSINSNRIHIDDDSLQPAIGHWLVCRDENNSEYYDAEGLANILLKSPGGFLFGVLLKLPVMIPTMNWIMKRRIS